MAVLQKDALKLKHRQSPQKSLRITISIVKDVQRYSQFLR